MSIQRESYRTSPGGKPTRRETREMAEWLGIDTSGMAIKGIRDAVDTELRKQEKGRQAVDEINDFARRKSDKNDAVNRGADPPAPPMVVSTVIETRETMGLPESKPKAYRPPTIRSGGETGGAFCTIITIVSEGDDNGDKYLQGGSINGITVPNILLYTAITDTWEGADGYFLFAPLTGVFPVINFVAMPGFIASSVGTPFWAASATDTYPDVAGGSPTDGVCNVNLGVVSAETFYPSGCGNRSIGLCIAPPYTGDV